MKIRIHYSDETLGEYNALEEAQEDILDVFGASDMRVTPELVEEVDEEGNQVAVYGCTWSVKLQRLLENV